MSTHAAIHYAVECPKAASDWEYGSNSLVCLTVPDEAELSSLYRQIQCSGKRVCGFTEPDIDEFTAFACLLSKEEAAQFTSSLPLALRDRSDQRWIREQEAREEVRSLSEGGEW